MRAVAYMLDTKIWTQKFIGKENGNNQVEYVIATPTIEQILNSYNKKYGTNKSAKVFIKESDLTSTGYKISNEGTSDDDYKELMTKAFQKADGSSDLTYVIQDKTKAKQLYMASAHLIGGSDRVMSINCGNYVGYISVHSDINNSEFGLRPIICLNYKVHLKEQENGSFVIQ